MRANNFGLDTLGFAYTSEARQIGRRDHRSQFFFLRSGPSFARLNGVSAAIIKAPTLTEHHVQLLHADIDRLESTLSGPDPQSREPADIGDYGLFADDEGEEKSLSCDVSTKEPQQKK